MADYVETLEQRTLFAASIPGSLAMEYQAVVSDEVAVRAGPHALATVGTQEGFTLPGDLKALGKSRENTVLFSKLRAAGLRYFATARADTAKLLAAVGELRRTELIEAAFDDDPSAANARRYDAAQRAGDRIDTQQAQALLRLYTVESLPGVVNSVSTVDADLNALVSANPGATQLASDVQAVQSAIASAVESANTAVVRIYVDIDTFVGGGDD